MVFQRNRDVYDYTLVQVFDVLKNQNKCTAIVSYTNSEDNIMANDNRVSAVYIISRKDLKSNIAHYRVHVYNEEFALLFTDDGLYDIVKYQNFSSMFPGFNFL